MEPAPRRPRGGFATRAVSGAAMTPQVDQRPVSAPIWPSATWATDRSAEVGALLADEQDGYVYGRYDNPTLTTLHGQVASLHGAEAAWALASGTAAIAATLDALRDGGRVLATSHLYGGTYALLARRERDDGWAVDRAPLLTVDDLDAALTDAHTVVHVETIANPSTAVADIAGMAERCRQRGVALVVDNTFASPYLCRPLELGATAVVESATKYLGGHGDVVAGVVAGDASLIARVRQHAVELGAALGPFDGWLVIRGLQTLALRMRQASASALAVAGRLEADPAVARVAYPGLESHPQHALAREQLAGHGGGICSLELASREAAERFVDACEVFSSSVSLGGTHSLALHPASTTHRQMDEAALLAAGMSQSMVRLSVGIEDVEDLLADVERACRAAGEDA